jgi:site-specific recombinase XerD
MLPTTVLTAYTNKDLRKLRIGAGLNKHISFHTARHSWAVRAFHKGMRIEYVSRLMGHVSVKNAEIYAKILDCELDKAMEVSIKIETTPNVLPMLYLKRKTLCK